MVLLSCCWFNGDGSGDSSFLDYFVKWVDDIVFLPMPKDWNLSFLTKCK
jgi:hypothetical protein